MDIFQELVDNQGFSASYQSVQRFVRKLQIALSPEPRVVIETAPGEEGQVDYGSGPMVRDPQTGKYRRTRLFVMTLGYSRHHQTAGRGHVCRRKTIVAALAAGTFSLLPVRRTYSPSGWLRGSRSGVLQRSAGLDRPPRSGAME